MFWRISNDYFYLEVLNVLAVWYNNGPLLFFNSFKKTPRFWTFYFCYLCLYIILKQYSFQYTKPKKASKPISEVSLRSKWSRSQEVFDQYFGGKKCYKSDNFAAVCSTASQETVQNNEREWVITEVISWPKINSTEPAVYLAYVNMLHPGYRYRTFLQLRAILTSEKRNCLIALFGFGFLTFRR